MGAAAPAQRGSDKARVAPMTGAVAADDACSHLGAREPNDQCVSKRNLPSCSDGIAFTGAWRRSWRHRKARSAERPCTRQ
jgi:hypothetical protein